MATGEINTYLCLSFMAITNEPLKFGRKKDHKKFVETSSYVQHCSSQDDGTLFWRCLTTMK
jgi:hypothetical protein